MCHTLHKYNKIYSNLYCKFPQAYCFLQNAAIDFYWPLATINILCCNCYQWKTCSCGIVRKRIFWVLHRRMGFCGELYWKCKIKWVPLLTSQCPVSIVPAMEKAQSCLQQGQDEGHCPEFPLHIEVQYRAAPGSVSYTHLTLPTNWWECRSRWSPYH